MVTLSDAVTTTALIPDAPADTIATPIGGKPNGAIHEEPVKA